MSVTYNSVNSALTRAAGNRVNAEINAINRGTLWDNRIWMSRYSIDLRSDADAVKRTAIRHVCLIARSL